MRARERERGSQTNSVCKRDVHMHAVFFPHSPNHLVTLKRMPTGPLVNSSQAQQTQELLQFKLNNSLSLPRVVLLIKSHPAVLQSYAFHVQQQQKHTFSLLFAVMLGFSFLSPMWDIPHSCLKHLWPFANTNLGVWPIITEDLDYFSHQERKKKSLYVKWSSVSLPATKLFYFHKI